MNIWEHPSPKTQRLDVRNISLFEYIFAHRVASANAVRIIVVKHRQRRLFVFLVRNVEFSTDVSLQIFEDTRLVFRNDPAFRSVFTYWRAPSAHVFEGDGRRDGIFSPVYGWSIFDEFYTVFLD